ncbi:hypothetical protein [uncultured Ruegeria sp.]|uniref:hypothetical protein n=1 Tax=uncultured Ruegeria sp. TaxID=259304 RepID=UPI0026391B2F|nr:hypothetical protein [uncultured Ruegeria sp.]
MTTKQQPTEPMGPPVNALSADAWRDFPNKIEPAQYLVENDNGESHVITVSKNMRRVLEALIQRPVYCASRCRIGHYVHLMRHDKRVEIVTDEYSNDSQSGRMRFGIFTLISKVTRIDGREVQS